MNLAAFSYVQNVAPCKGIQASRGFRIPHRGFRIPDSDGWIPDSKPMDSGFQTFCDSGFQRS